MSGDERGGGSSAEADLETMVQLMGRMARRMKGAGSHGEARRLLDRIAAAGLGPRHVPVLFSLVLHGPQPVGVLAGHLALSPATVSQLVGELQRGGFVDRRADEADRRRMIVSLAGHHRDLVERFALARIEPLRMALRALGEEERAHFLHGWATVVEMMERYADGDTGGTGGDAACDPDGSPDGPEVSRGA